MACVILLGVNKDMSIIIIKKVSPLGTPHRITQQTLTNYVANCVKLCGSNCTNVVNYALLKKITLLAFYSCNTDSHRLQTALAKEPKDVHV